MMRRILIAGSRDWQDWSAIEHALRRFEGAPLTLVSGACPTGADYIAETIAASLGWVIERHPADWAKWGKQAGYLRNRRMVELGANVCLAFIKNGSRGATMTADLAQKAGIPTRRIIR